MIVTALASPAGATEGPPDEAPRTLALDASLGFGSYSRRGVARVPDKQGASPVATMGYGPWLVLGLTTDKGGPWRHEVALRLGGAGSLRYVGAIDDYPLPGRNRVLEAQLAYRYRRAFLPLAWLRLEVGPEVGLTYTRLERTFPSGPGLRESEGILAPGLLLGVRVRALPSLELGLAMTNGVDVAVGSREHTSTGTLADSGFDAGLFRVGLGWFTSWDVSAWWHAGDRAALGLTYRNAQDEVMRHLAAHVSSRWQLLLAAAVDTEGGR